MQDIIVVLLVAYIQIGLILGWYLFYKRVLTVRDELAAGQHAQEDSFAKLSAEVEELRRVVQEARPPRERRAEDRDSHILKQAKRRGALEMARRGMDIDHIAATLSMRRAEVDLLVRMERMQRNTRLPVSAPPVWLDTAS